MSLPPRKTEVEVQKNVLYNGTIYNIKTLRTYRDTKLQKNYVASWLMMPLRQLFFSTLLVRAVSAAEGHGCCVQ